jgi:hypothetical protein
MKLDCSSVRNRIALPSGRSESARKSTFEMYVFQAHLSFVVLIIP